MSYRSTDDIDPCVRVYGTRVHNLRGVDVVAPRDALVAFTGISGSGKSSLAFGTIYAEAQRRYFESVAPYARRLLLPTGAPKVDDITGLPPAVALQQRRGSATSRSTVGTVTTLSNLLRMLFSRAGTYPRGATERLDSDAFSPNTAVGACPECHGLGRIHRVTEETLVPDPSLTIREGAVAAWPGAWQGQNLRDILVTLGYDIDKPWRKLPKRQRNWILFTDEQPTVEIDPGQHPVQADYYYNGTFSSAERHVRHTLANSHSAMMRRRVLQFVDSVECPVCNGSGLRPEALKVTFAGRTIADYAAMPLADLADTLRPTASRTDAAAAYESTKSGELTEVATMIAADLVARLQILIDLGLGYLTLSRRTPTVSPGELQRLRLATQLRAGLFGVLYVLDEPSAGLHPADAEPLLDVLDRLRRAGNSLFVVEHDMDVVRRADWIVDVGPGAGELGGDVLYSGPVPGLADIEGSVTRRYLFDGCRAAVSSTPHAVRAAAAARDLLPQFERPRRGPATWCVHRGHRSVRFRQVDARRQGPRRCREQPSRHGTRCRAGRIRRRRSRHRDRRSRSRRERRCDGRGGRGDQPAGISRPAPDRTHAALDAGDLHRLVRRRAPRIRCDPEGASPRLDSGQVFLQRGRRSLPHLSGGGVRVGRIVVPAGDIRHMPGVPRSALLRRDTGSALSGPYDRRRARDDRR